MGDCLLVKDEKQTPFTVLCVRKFESSAEEAAN